MTTKIKGNVWVALLWIFLTAAEFSGIGYAMSQAGTIPWGYLVAIIFVCLYGGACSMMDFACEVIGRRDLRQ